MEKQEQIDAILIAIIEEIEKLENEKALLDHNIINSFKTMTQDNVALVSFEFYKYMNEQIKICNKISEKYKYMIKQVYELEEAKLTLINQSIINSKK